MRPMSEQSPSPILIDVQDLSPSALDGIIESFIQREGTDYGLNEISPEKKFENLKKQVLKGEVLIVFDPESESVTLIGKQEARGLKKP